MSPNKMLLDKLENLHSEMYTELTNLSEIFFPSDKEGHPNDIFDRMRKEKQELYKRNMESILEMSDYMCELQWAVKELGLLLHVEKQKFKTSHFNPNKDENM